MLNEYSEVGRRRTLACVTARRPYRSRVREEQAARTRAAIVDAALALFSTHGWAGTSVRAIAEAADVSEATVYATYGSKAGLAVSLVQVAAGRAGVDTMLTEVASANGDPAAQLRAFVEFDRRLFDVGGPLIGLVVDGRVDSPDLEAAYRNGRARGDAARREVLLTWDDDVWRDGVDADVALDLYAGLCTLPGFRVLRDERGWDADRIAEWWWRTLVTTLFADPV